MRLMAVVPVLLVLVATPSPLTAQTPPPAGVMPMVAALMCGPDELTVVVQRDVARVTFRGQRYEMRQVTAASGAKYEMPDDATTSFWSKGANGTLTIAGQTFPECTPRQASARGTFVALGHEPGWRLEIAASGALTLTTDNGATTTRIARATVERRGTERIYRGQGDGRDVVAHLRRAVCADSMTGQPRPETVEVTFDGRVLKGCGGDAATLLHGNMWTVDEVAGAAVAAGARPTMQFFPDGRIAGSASCNTYRGRYTVTAEGLSILNPTSTMKACEPARMAQEQAVLAVLRGVVRFSIADDGALVLEAGDGRRLIARRPARR